MTDPSRSLRHASPAGSLRLARIRRLASAEGYELLLALSLLLEVDLRLRCTGFARVHGVLSRPTQIRGGVGLSERRLAQARRMALALRRAARFVPRARCLHRALALLLWLRRQGVIADLRMGVRASEEEIEGHAWVEWHGIALDEERSLCDRFPLLEPPRCP